jgi:hypothetical protein
MGGRGASKETNYFDQIVKKINFIRQEEEKEKIKYVKERMNVSLVMRK